MGCISMHAVGGKEVLHSMPIVSCMQGLRRIRTYPVSASSRPELPRAPVIRGLMAILLGRCAARGARRREPGTWLAIVRRAARARRSAPRSAVSASVSEVSASVQTHCTMP